MLRNLPYELDVGQREITLPSEFAAADIHEICLVGMRDRLFRLIRYPHDEYQEFSQEMRGMPTRFATYHKTVKFWPVPSHYWRVVVTVRAKDLPPPEPLITGAQS